MQCIYSSELSKSALSGIDSAVNQLNEKGNIPGLCVVLVQDTSVQFILKGYSELEKNVPVNANTVFELASCSKAFTALSILALEKEGLLSLSQDVSDIIPWFKPRYKGNEVDVTIEQLLHHTSGIPAYTLAKIPAGNSDSALAVTAREVLKCPLHNLPGTRYEYSTANYDILGLIIELKTNLKFEKYIAESVFKPLGLRHTFAGSESRAEAPVAQGYKIGFFKPQEFTPPVYRGNLPAGYVSTNAEDMALWLQYQIGSKKNVLSSLINKSHLPDHSVYPELSTMSYYAKGWEKLMKEDVFFHTGMNPNFSSFVKFNKKKKTGVAVLANSNSFLTTQIGNEVYSLLNEEPNQMSHFEGQNKLDQMSSIVTLCLAIYLVFVFAYFVYIIVGLSKKNRSFSRVGVNEVVKMFGTLVITLPYVFGLFFIPKAIAGFSWDTAIVWTPASFETMVYFAVVSIGFTYFIYCLTVFFKEKNVYKRNIPPILLLSILTSVSNIMLILLITNSIKSEMNVKYLGFYFSIILLSYILSKKSVKTKLIDFSLNIIYDLRLKLIGKLLSTSFQNFESINKGMVYTTLNDDTNTLSKSSDVFVGLITSLITVAGVFIYLATIAFWATALTIMAILIIASLFYLINRNANHLLERARSTRDEYLSYINGLIDGYKELSISNRKKEEYKADVEVTVNSFRHNISVALKNFLTASIVGDTFLLLILGISTLFMPMLFPNIDMYTTISFVIVILYLIGPVNTILATIPELMQIRVSWLRINRFIAKIPDDGKGQVPQCGTHAVEPQPAVQKLEIENIEYTYDAGEHSESFSVGPVSIELKRGELLFVTGGNGSGKTTLSKIITGLYTPHKGTISIDDKPLAGRELSEYFSVIYNPLHLFKKLYGVDVNGKKDVIDQTLELLKIRDKVQIEGNTYSTIELSSGQKKRLAMLQCYLEDRPVYLFDEWAADQDPEYRKFFYESLLPQLCAKGKIVIAITHDDHYFHTADKLMKLRHGKVDAIESSLEVFQAKDS